MNFIIKPPTLFRKILKNAVWKINTDEKEIFLTFDDGPTSKITNWILDILKDFNAKATFFCIGKNVESNKKVFQKILDNEHSVGNHTFNHLNGWKTTTDEYIENIKKTDNIFNSNLFRPPYGRIKIEQFNIIKNYKKIVLWDVLSKDYSKKMSKEQTFENIEKNTNKGSIIVFHDSLKAENNMKYSLNKTLIHFSNFGYKFSKIQ